MFVYAYPMLDDYHRAITNMRISITQRCNLACDYCHREGEAPSQAHAREMSPAEIAKIVELAVKLGIHKIKITGGEPLVRDDIIDIVTRISPLLQDLSMTTNGILLDKYGKALRNAGLDRVNISLDTLNTEIYRKLTGKSYLSKVIVGIDTVKNNGIKPIKLNMVLMKGVNDNEVEDMTKFCATNNMILQLIELETTKDKIGSDFYRQYHCSLDDIEHDLNSRAMRVQTRAQQHRNKYYIHPQNSGSVEVEVEVVKPMHNTEFCRFCNRLRLTSDGYLKPCLLRNDNHLDLLSPLREGAEDEELLTLMKTAIKLKEPYWQ